MENIENMNLTETEGYTPDQYFQFIKGKKQQKL